MINALYYGYIADDVNENTELGFAGLFAGAGAISFILTAHQAADSPDTAGVQVEVQHRDESGTYEPVPNVVLAFNAGGIGSTVTSVIEIPPGTLKALGRVVLKGTGTGNPKGAGSVTAVW